jgi:hypothetical protein
MFPIKIKKSFQKPADIFAMADIMGLSPVIYFGMNFALYNVSIK